MSTGLWIITIIAGVMIAATVLAYALARSSDDPEEDER